ncbi:MAM and LDL-receptor class A domain-containing protein 2-like [Dermacentor albipictus]|uniref:MAM and LDL-receptor class A domain-containing protein 2-like n=1 Tax=Dermacentor albipictus TaxID=60249 RepID=UPI0038FBEA23
MYGLSTSSLSLKGADAAEVECDFEHGVCEFSSSCKGGDCFEPVRANLVNEGPAVDHTTGGGDGWYSRAQFSRNSWYESVAQLELSTAGPFCFSAWVHVSGLKLPRVEMASRQLDAGLLGDEAGMERVFYRVQSSHPELWRNVLYYEDRRGSMQIEIRAWHFTNGSVGVDDLSVSSGSCPTDPLDGSCSFDRSVCGYENAVGGSSNKWRRIPPGRSASRNKAVALDHTTDTIRGGYVSLLVPANTVTSKILTSPMLSGSAEEPTRCIRFFYFAPAPNHHSGLELLLSKGSALASDSQQPDLVRLWGVDYNSLISGAWMPAEVGFIASDNYELHFRCYVEHAWNSSWYCAVDDIEVYACGDQKGKGISCDFDSGHLCNWTDSPEPSGVAGQWRLSDLHWGEPHFPYRDHTRGTSKGGFVYAENKDQKSVVKAVLISSTWDASWVGGACLIFWHFAVFNQPGSCNLTASPMSGDPWWSSTHELERAWKPEVIRVWLPSDQHQFRLEASLTDALIAVDDVTLTFGACPSEQRGLSCDFERGPCTWTNSVKKRRTWEWLLRGGHLNTDVPQPSLDHTLSSDEGSFMLVSGREMQQAGTAELQSEVVDLDTPGAQCMDFWYTVHGSQGAQITFKVTVHRNTPRSNPQYEELWFHKEGNVTAWQLGRVKIPRQHRVTFEAAVLQSRDGYIALDDIGIYINDDCSTMPAEATAGKAAYVILECVWNTPNRCSWSRPDEIVGTWKLGSRFPPRYALAPAASPNGKPNDFIYLSCSKLHSSGAAVSASLSSPIVPLQQTAVCAHFSFHMFGPGKRELSLSLRTRQDHASTQSKTHELFRAYGGTVADSWYHVARTIRFSAHATALEFSVSSDKCERGDIALSNIHVTPGVCMDNDDGRGLCDFEHNTCYWHNKGWTHVLTGMRGDMASASLRSGPANSAGFLQLVWSKGAANQASLSSLLWPVQDQPRTVELWYYRNVTGNGILEVYLVDKAGSQLAKIWTLPNATEPHTWSLARAEIPDQTVDFKVVIEGKFDPRSNVNAVIAVDNVLLDLLPPAHVADCDFDRDLCGYVSKSDSDFRWIVGSGRVFRRQPGAQTYNMISSGAGNPGRFAYVDTTVSANNSAALRSAHFSSKGNETLAVRYFRSGTALESFQIYQLVLSSRAKETTRLLLADLLPKEQWQRVELPLHEAGDSQLEFTLTGSSSQTGGVAAIAGVSVASAVKGGSEPAEEPIPDLTCAFDDGSYCLWKSDTNAEGQAQWELSDTATGQPSFPLFDHSTRNSTGRFITAKNVGSDASVSRIKSLPLPAQLSASGLCFSFWYFTLTERNSSISVTLAPSSSPSWFEPGARMTAWTPALVYLAGSATAKRTQIVVEASIQDGLIAADDFSVTHGNCTKPSLCAFEGSVECGQTRDLSNVREWTVQQGSQLGVADHTLRSTFGHFLYLNTTSVRQSRNSIARIHLPVRNATPDACLTFWWRAHGEQSELNVYRFVHAEGLGNALLSVDTEESIWWNGRSVNVAADRPWQVVFEARIPDFFTTESGILLDDIELAQGACPDQHACTFEGPTCLAWENSYDPFATGWWQHQRAGLSGFPSDHTTGTPEGHYLRFSAKSPGQFAVLTAGGSSSDARCATFWYLLSDELHGLILLAGPTYFNESTHGQWRSAQFSLTNHYRSIIAVSGSNPKAFALVDDLLVHDSDCTNEGDVSAVTTASTAKIVTAGATTHFGTTFVSTSSEAVTVATPSVTNGEASSTMVMTTASSSSMDTTMSSFVPSTIPTTSVSTAVRPTCGKGMFSCRDRAHCVPALLLCDGVRDCPNGADELCGDHEFCPGGHYFCQKPSTCLDASKLCDGREDCSDGSDEILCNDCPGYFCRNQGNCSFHTVTGAPECMCKASFQGNRCQKKLVEDNSAESSARGASRGWAYGAPLLVLFILGFTTTVVIYLRRKKNKEARSEIEKSRQVVIENPIYGLEFGQDDTPKQPTLPRTSWFSRTIRFPTSSRVSTSEC